MADEVDLVVVEEVADIAVVAAVAAVAAAEEAAEVHLEQCIRQNAQNAETLVKCPLNQKKTDRCIADPVIKQITHVQGFKIQTLSS